MYNWDYPEISQAEFYNQPFESLHQKELLQRNYTWYKNNNNKTMNVDIFHFHPSFCTWTQKNNVKSIFDFVVLTVVPQRKKNLCVHRFLKIQQKSLFKTKTERKRFNPSTPKIWLLILPSSCYTFPSKLIMIIWC